MLVTEITKGSEEDFLRLCEDFYNSGVTKRGFEKQSAIRTFNQVISKHENLWGFFIEDKDTADKCGYALITSYWCNEEAGNVIILDEIYIAREYRHRGFGKKFMKWLETEFKEKAVAITLEVLSTNLIAKDLYTKEGFVEDGFVTFTKNIH